MQTIISKVDRVLTIPPYMRGKFPNKETLKIEFKAEVPQEVPDYVAEYYTRNWGKIFRYADQEAIPEEQSKESEDNEEDTFQPLEWLEVNYSNVEEAIKQLKWREVQAVSKALNINSYGQSRERVEDRIVHDIAVKNKQQEEMEEHKAAS